MKKCLAWILVLTLCMGLLAGCGAASKGTAADSDGFRGALNDAAEGSLEYSTEVVGSTSLSGTGSSVTPVEVPNQKLIRKFHMEAETEDLDALLEAITEQTKQLGGYFEQQEIYNGSSNAQYRYRHGTLTIRIPADKLDTFVAKVTEESNIVSSNETTDDVTLNYVAIESRITALETEQTRLLELLAKAETTKDLLEIEKRLTEVRTDLEAITSELRVLDNQVNYGTVNLSVTEVKEYTVVDEPETVWQRIGTGFMQSLKGLGNFFTNLFVFIIVASPYLVFIAAIVVAVLLIIRAAKKKKRKKNLEN